MPMKDVIAQKLQDAFLPSHLEVIDESHQHAGHGGWREAGETHFRVRMTSAAFAGQSRVTMHRAINTLLAAELQGGVHALAIEAKAG